MEHRTLFGSVALSWLGSVIGTTADPHKLASYLTLALSAAASFYAIRVAKRTLATRGLEDVEHQQKICAQCIAGNPPAVCPFSPGQRPKTCKRNL